MHRVLMKAAKQTLIVLIDDSPTVCKILEVSLHRAGYEDVRTFPDGPAFFRWLMTSEARIPALIIIDLNLPRMDGYSLIQHLKAKPAFSQTAFVILTGRHGMLDRLKGRLSGAQVYLTKPFRTQDIITTVQTLLGPSSIEDGTETTFPLASNSRSHYEYTNRYTLPNPYGGHA